MTPWTTLDDVRSRLAAGIDPDTSRHWAPPLFDAAEFGSAEAVAELARAVSEVDSEWDGRTALWVAVSEGRSDNARALAAAGADPWRPMMGGWSPGRLSLTGDTPDLFGAVPEGIPGLSEADEAIAAEARRLIPVLREVELEGMSLTCVRGIDAAEAMRRLNAQVTDEVTEDFDPYDDLPLTIVGLTDVPGGCVVVQPWAYGAARVGKALSPGTVSYGMYANPKSGNQGDHARDGEPVSWGLNPGGWPSASGSAAEILLESLYQHHALAYCCAFVGLRLTDARAFEQPDVWVELGD